MKRLMTFVLFAVLSLGVASVSLAEEGGSMGGQAAGGEMQHSGKTTKKHKKKHEKKHKKSKTKEAPAEEVK